MTPSEALKQIEIDSIKAIEEEMNNFYTRLVQASPVDTGHFKISWRVPRRVAKWKWRIHNRAEYASILANGRYHALGRWYGSLQWAGGLAPMLGRTRNIIQRRLDDIRH